MAADNRSELCTDVKGLFQAGKMLLAAILCEPCHEEASCLVDCRFTQPAWPSGTLFIYD